MSDTQSYIPESIITAIQIPKIPLPSLQKPPHISLADMIPYIIRPNKYFRKDYILPDYRSRPMGPIWSIKSDTWEEPEISVPNYPSPFVRPICRSSRILWTNPKYQYRIIGISISSTTIFYRITEIFLWDRSGRTIRILWTNPKSQYRIIGPFRLTITTIEYNCKIVSICNSNRARNKCS